jgi:GNAT superfamily N-acetyltransferase
MRIEVRQVTRRRQLKEFIHLPARIHRQHERWVPPLYADERHFFNPDKNRGFSYCDTTLALAYRDGSPSGRIMGIVHRRYNELRNEAIARFGYLDCFEDQEVARALLGYIEEWARKKGMKRIVGPMGFTDQDPQGFLVEGYENEPTTGAYYNFEYIVRFLEDQGYRKEVDYVVYKVIVPERIPEAYERIHKRLLSRGEFALVEFTRRKDLKPYSLPVLNLMNETYQNLYGFVPLDEQETAELIKRYYPVIDPRFLKAVTKEDQVVGFILGIPNMNEGIRRAKGRLLPFGVFRIMRAAKRAKQLDLLLGGIKEEHRGRGLDVLMAIAMIRSAKNAGFEYMDSHQELETNVNIRAEMERMGGQVYKRYRIFQKEL